jgi:menaquinone-9 beta-reductase
MKESVDVFVVGGGPAGLVAAIAARQQGFSVMVADGSDHPIDKPCGEGLIPETQAILARLNIRIPGGAGFRFHGIRFVQNQIEASAEYPVGKGLGIRRTVLHDLLVAHAEQCGVRMRWKTPAIGIGAEGVDLKQGRVSARWIVGADGSSSRVRRWAGLDATSHRHQRFAIRRHYRVKPWSEYMEIHWGPAAQGYVTPISDQEICVVMLSERSEDANFGETLRCLPELKSRLADAEVSSRERGAMTAMHRLKSVCRGNVALVGDASGSVDAITGEGLRLAFCQALNLAEGMKRGDLSEYQSFHKRLSKRPTFMGNLLLLMGRNRLVRNRALRSLSVEPALFAKLLVLHSGRAGVGTIVTAGARLGWGFLGA